MINQIAAWFMGVASSFLASAFHPMLGLKTFKITGQAQGTTYAVTYYARTEAISKAQADSIFRTLDASLSTYQPTSLISRFNRSEDGIEMDGHLARVVERSLQIYRETGGLSDMTVYPLVQAWGFGSKENDVLPDSAAVRELMHCIGSDKLQVSGSMLTKALPCVQIDVNGIAQGYSVDVVAGFLEARGVRHYMVEVGGEIRTKGRKYPGKKPMTIGIETPAMTGFEAPEIRAVIHIGDGAVTTSGSYRKFTEMAGRRLSHIIDPKTGFPVQREIISATVVAPDAITADGFDNALLAAGLDGAFEILRRHPELQAYLIYKKPDGTVADTASAGFRKYLVR